MNRQTIYSVNGSVFEFDPRTEMIYKDGMIVSSRNYEPIYLKSGPSETPIFTGIYLKETNRILLMCGEIVPNTPSKTLSL